MNGKLPNFVFHEWPPEGLPFGASNKTEFHFSLDWAQRIPRSLALCSKREI